MLLRQLLHQFDPRLNAAENRDVEILGICEDSRLVERGELFVARSGTSADGKDFVGQAIQRGAAAAVTRERLVDCAVPQVIIADPGAAAGPLANIFHGLPAKTVRVVGVTGTNGKTTTTYLLRQILNCAGRRCGLIGTVEIDDGRNHIEATMTTPGPIGVAKMLAQMRDNSCAACAMEVSSHALHQGRVGGIDFAGAAFTNLTRDHLDYHGTMKNYAAAKARLFEMLGENAVAVVNADDPASARMIAKCRAKVIHFGFGRSADYRAADVAMNDRGTHFVLHAPDGRCEIELAMIGRHNIANALTAAALAAEIFGLSVHQIADGLKGATGAPGRLQAVRCGQPFTVLVDYAHTDDALEKVLASLRPLTRGKLRVLFGCGGDRDRTKRPLMAKAAQRLADVVYVTSDNPRTEKPDAIIAEIRAGFGRHSKKPVIVEVDRRTAIGRILQDADGDDVVLLAGKGHENYQIIGRDKTHFDDVEEAMRVLERKGISSA